MAERTKSVDIIEHNVDDLDYEQIPPDIFRDPIRLIKWIESHERLIDNEKPSFEDIYDDNIPYEEIFFLTSGTANARGVLEGKKFRVLKGSKLSDSTSIQFNNDKKHHNVERRTALISAGIVVDGIFVKDYVFNSPSAAARILLGRSANGKIEWHLKSGIKLKEVLENSCFD